VIYSNYQPITPFSKINGNFTFGNLKPDKMTDEAAYFLRTTDNEVYQVGVILNKNVSEKIKTIAEETQ
jgi:hypothetical protein